MNTKTTPALRIALALASLAALVVVLPVLGMVGLGLLALVVPVLLVLTPVLVLFLFLQRYYIAGLMQGSVKG